MADICADLQLRSARVSDSRAVARIMRAALSSHSWMPTLHSPEEDLAFVADAVLPLMKVIVAERAGVVLGFIAVKGAWVEQLYLDPPWTGRGIGTALLSTATRGLKEARLYCFQANRGACRFYERHGFRIEARGTGSGNEEGLPDILYIRRS